MIQGCYDCQNKWMYLLPFCFPATIFITLHSSSEQVLPTLYFQPMQLSSLVMIMYRWLDLFIASWHLFFFLKFLPDFGADSFCANSSKVTLFSAKFALVCWRPKHDHCPDRCEFLQHVVSSHTGRGFLGALCEAEQEPKLRENLFTNASNAGDEDNWPAWRGLTTTDSTGRFWGLKQVYSSHGRRIYCFAMLPS